MYRSTIFNTLSYSRNSPLDSQLDSPQKSLLTRSMALRVLLADESVTIKKVFQLALQDFAVEVTTVNVGIDVVQVAEKIKPDIIFADVLLQKMSGYDVSRAIKEHPQLSQTPVVLIWSGFMELDKDRYKSSGAGSHLEKPFDTQHLRKIVQTLVPKTQTQPLSDFLNFPKLPAFAEEAPVPAAAQAPAPQVPSQISSVKLPPLPTTPNAATAKTGAATPTTSTTKEWSMDNFESIDHIQIPPVPGLSNEEPVEEFVAVPLPKENNKPRTLNPNPERMTTSEGEDDGDGQWVQKTLKNFKLAPEKRTNDVPTVKYNVPKEKINPDEFLTNTWAGTASKVTSQVTKTNPPPLKTEKVEDEDVFELDLSDTSTSKTLSEEFRPSIQAKVAGGISEERLEEIIRAQAKEVIEKVVWQVVPEIATRVIERELERLLKERSTL
jgi:two-component system cell cycle response regulator